MTEESKFTLSLTLLEDSAPISQNSPLTNEILDKLRNMGYNTNDIIICKDCKITPKIQFNDFRDIKVICKCQTKDYSVEEAYNTFYLSKSNFEQIDTESNNSMDDIEKNEEKPEQEQEEFELFCKIHGKNIFKYFCNVCEKNLCSYCLNSHSCTDSNNLVRFEDFQPEMIEKINYILTCFNPEKSNYFNVKELELLGNTEKKMLNI